MSDKPTKNNVVTAIIEKKNGKLKSINYSFMFQTYGKQTIDLNSNKEFKKLIKRGEIIGFEY